MAHCPSSYAMRDEGPLPQPPAGYTLHGDELVYSFAGGSGCADVRIWKTGVWVDEETKHKVWGDIRNKRFGNIEGSLVAMKRSFRVLYHYTDRDASQKIISNHTIFASTRLSTDCDFGVGQYATGKAPHHFSSILEILYNNYPRATAKYKPGDKQFPKEDRAAYCIPLVVPCDATPSLPLSDRMAPPGRIREASDRYGPFDATKHDIWLVDSTKVSGGGKHSTGQSNVALLVAARQGQCDIVQEQLAKGVHVDAVDSCYHTALFHAAEKGHIDVVRLLVAKGASVSLVLNDSEVHGEVFSARPAISELVLELQYLDPSRVFSMEVWDVLLDADPEQRQELRARHGIIQAMCNGVHSPNEEATLWEQHIHRHRAVFARDRYRDDISSFV